MNTVLKIAFWAFVLGVASLARAAAPDIGLGVPSTVYVGENFWVSVSASDPDGDLRDMGLRWQGQGQVAYWTISGGSATEWVLLTAPSTPGTINLRGEVNDLQLNGTTGGWESVEVIYQPSPPSADMGGPSTAIVDTEATYTFSASDADGDLYRWRVSLLPGSANWSYISGSSQSGSMSYTFSTPGTYTFRLEVEDSEGLTSYDDHTVVVTSTPTYTLTVQNGSGGASGLSAGSTRPIAANSPPGGQAFNGWTLTSGPGSIANPSQSSTTFTLGSGNATVTATYTSASSYYDVLVTGASTGAVWGSGPYTDDSNLAVAAVHAGLLQVNQSAVIRVTDTGPQSSFTGTTANGVMTYNYGYWPGSFTLSRVSSTPPTIALSAPSSVYPNSPVAVSVSASDPDGDLSGMSVRWLNQGIQANWTISGGSVTKDTTITSPGTPGTMEIRGEVVDATGSGIITDWHTVTVAPAPPNQAPTASISAPPNWVVGFPGLVSHAATDADGNLYRWRLRLMPQDSGWTNVSGSSVSGATEHTFAAPGTYTFRVEAEDTNNATGYDEVTVSVAAAPTEYLYYVPSTNYSSFPNYPTGAPSFAHLNDGSHATGYGYASDTGDTNWLMADLGSARTVETVTVGGGLIVDWGVAADASAGAELQYSNNGTSWTTAHTYATGFSPSGTTVSVNVAARYWRLYRANNWLATTEFRLQGDGTGYTLTVTGGTGGGSALAEGNVRTIVANPATEEGEMFTHWTKLSTHGSIANANSAVTQFTMGAGNGAVEAHYGQNSPPTGAIEIVNAAQSPVQLGQTRTISYSAADVDGNLQQWRVSLSLNQAAWTPISGSSASSSFQYTFSEAKLYRFTFEVLDAFGRRFDAEVVIDLNPPGAYTLTVLNGSGGASGLNDGAVRTITANAPAAGQVFSGWSIVSGPGALASTTLATTTFTMGAGHATVQANYTADSTPPTVPTGLAASSITPTSFILSWNASTDANGISGYEVEQNGSSLGMATGTSRTLTNLTASTLYTLRVRARDMAQNWSDWSSPALQVTTAAVGSGANSDNDDLTDAEEQLLGTNPNVTATSDPATLQLNVLTPQ